MLCGIEFQTVGAANLKALRILTNGLERIDCRRSNNEDWQGLDRKLRLTRNERFEGEPN